MKTSTKRFMILTMLLCLNSLVKTETIDEFVQVPLPKLRLSKKLFGFDEIDLKPFVDQEMEEIEGKMSVEKEDVNKKWSKLVEGGMASIFVHEDYTYVLKVMSKQTIDAFRPLDAQNPFQNEVDANKYLKFFFEAKSKELDFKRYFLEFSDYSKQLSSQKVSELQSKLDEKKMENGPAQLKKLDSDVSFRFQIDDDDNDESLETEDSSDQLVFMAMEGLTVDLGSKLFLKLWASMRVVERVQFYADLFEHLAVLHETGVMHCDIKPDNIMILVEDSPFISESDRKNIEKDSFLAIVKQPTKTSTEDVIVSRILFKIIDYGFSQARVMNGKHDPICRYSNDYFSLGMIQYPGMLKQMNGSFVEQDLFSMSATIIQLELYARGNTQKFGPLHAKEKLKEAEQSETSIGKFPEKLLEIISLIIDLDDHLKIEDYVNKPGKSTKTAFSVWTDLNDLALKLGSPFALDQAQAKKKIETITRETNKIRETIKQAPQEGPKPSMVTVSQGNQLFKFKEFDII